ncbi:MULTISPECIES: SHOCT domain-containing protein [unclassified Thermococcus]|nr:MULTISPECIES: SHOCT domain-containing protein [unclassified Thermococcus]
MRKLKKLKELYDMGVIIQEEYEEKRTKLLRKI